MPDTALAENIEFFKSDGFGYIHVELGGGKTFGRQVECRVAGDGFFRNQDTPGMNAAGLGKSISWLPT